MFALAGLAVAFLLLPLGIRYCVRSRWLVRSSDFHHCHEKPVPRLGGLVLAIAFIAIELCIALVYPEYRAARTGRAVVLLASMAMFGLGFWDDLKPLGARKKLLGQVMIALSVCFFGIGIQVLQVPFSERVVALGGWGVLVTVIWLVTLTNLINLIDGADGLAGGICLMLMLLLAYVGSQNGSCGLLAVGMAGALLGFLWFNFPPARAYLGDGGAYLLGFQIGLFSLLNSQKGTVFAALVAPLFVLALPIVDTSLAVLRRGLRGLPLFRPDQRHLHHHLLGLGFSRRKVVLCFYAVTLLFLCMGLTAFWSRGELIPVLFGLGVVLLLFLAGKLKFSREWFSVGRVVGNSLNMRQQVQYALSLMRWLELESARQTSLEGLWTDLVFAVRKLGFSSVTLTLADGQRRWGKQACRGESHSLTFALKSGRYGTLQLVGPSVDSTRVVSPGQSPPRPGLFLQEKALFEIISELVAEGWSKAASRWVPDERQMLRFDARMALTTPVARNKWLPQLPVFGKAQSNG
jgi:UDP-GlcNAc:undecaprenyl-phosphate GlcNAc-1-phosphate transferase